MGPSERSYEIRVSVISLREERALLTLTPILGSVCLVLSDGSVCLTHYYYAV